MPVQYEIDDMEIDDPEINRLVSTILEYVEPSPDTSPAGLDADQKKTADSFDLLRELAEYVFNNLLHPVLPFIDMNTFILSTLSSLTCPASPASGKKAMLQQERTAAAAQARHVKNLAARFASVKKNAEDAENMKLIEELIETL